jgi:mannitol-1-/sugar-/sorbitol-6-/2-deoxyglucose-6-phosphatase
MISAAIFDMDGVLIDSEPFWRKAEIELFKTVGVELNEEMCLNTMGLTCGDAVYHWYNRFHWEGKTPEELTNEIELHVINSIKNLGKPMKGVEKIISFFNNRSISIALASSSSIRIIEAVLDRLKLRDDFKIYHSAQYEKKGKPDPAVFLSTARLLYIKPENCLVFEDSINGIKAGLAAGMKVIGVPEPHMHNDARYNMAHMVIHSLNEFDDQHLSMF